MAARSDRYVNVEDSTIDATDHRVERLLGVMRLLSILYDSIVGALGSFAGVMNPADLAAVAGMGRRWLARLLRAVWRDLPDVPRPE